MATAADDVPRYASAAFASLSPEEIETASIHSAAPSYTSDAPSYHTINPHPEPLPPYSPPESSTSSNTNNTTTHRVSSLLDVNAPPPTSNPNNNTNTNQRPNPPPPRRSSTSDVTLNHFRIPPWSPASSASRNPNVRIYQNVALRRAAAAANPHHHHSSNSLSSTFPSPYHALASSSSSSSVASLEGLMRTALMLERIEEEELLHQQRNRIRPLEDPYLVGEEAAARARQERIARERLLAEDGGGVTGMDWGEEVLVRENRRWDLFLAQMKDREERERTRRRLRRDADRRLSSLSSGSRLPFRIGARF